jgi:hypothetical protein
MEHRTMIVTASERDERVMSSNPTEEPERYPGAGPRVLPTGSATRSAAGVRWIMLFIPAILLMQVLRGHFGWLLVTVLALALIPLGIFFPLQRRAQRRAVARTAQTGALWAGAVVAQPPNLAFGQSGQSFYAAYTRSYWRTIARGTLVVYPQALDFVPRKPTAAKQPVRILPEQVASIGAARYSYGSVLDVHLWDGNKRRFSLYVGPGALNDALRQAGFPVS